jgi:site-specific recombinase XerD
MSQEIEVISSNVPVVYSEAAHKFAQASRAKNTRTAYRSLWKSFVTWRNGNSTLPVSVEEVVNYIAEMALSKYRVATINSSLAAIKHAHTLAGMSSPTDHPDVTTVFDGIRNTYKKVKPTKKQALELEDLSSLVASIPDSLVGKRDRALILIGFAGALRRSELVALEYSDIKIGRQKMTITIQSSKTDQHGDGVSIDIPALENKALCPVTALVEWLKASKITSGAIFRMVDRWNAIREAGLTGQSVALILKHYAELNHLDVNKISGHTLRRSLVNAAIERDNTPTEVKMITRHLSDSAFNEYVNVNSKAQMKVIKTAFGE